MIVAPHQKENGVIVALIIIGYALGAFLTTLIVLANWDAFGFFRDDPSIYMIAAVWPVWVAAFIVFAPFLAPMWAARYVARRQGW